MDPESDASGRFLIANLYAPNCQQDTFIKRHLNMLQRFSEGQLIVGSDLNVPLIPTEDTPTGMSSITRGPRKTIHSAIHNLQLIDTWRLFHPGERD